MAVFINYRREDSEGDARAIYNWLSNQTDKGNIFLDFEAIDAGDNWRNRINETLNNVQVVLVIIGPRWLEILKQREVADGPDLVRHEVALSLTKSRVRVIPVTVKGSKMPDKEKLPKDIQSLADQNAIEIRGSTWTDDANRLLTKLRQAKSLPVPRRTRLWRFVSSIFIILLALAGIYYFALVEVPNIPKHSIHKFAKLIVEQSGLKFKATMPHQDGNAPGVDVVVSQSPSAGARIFSGGYVEAKLQTITPFHLFCKYGGMLKNPTENGTLLFEKYEGTASFGLKEGTCAWRDRQINENETAILKPIGFMNELLAAFEKAPGGYIELCVFSKYPEPVTTATQSEYFIAVSYDSAPFTIDNLGKVELKADGLICDDRYFESK
jgi:hypothetical protein